MIKYTEITGQRIKLVREYFKVSRPKMAEFLGLPATTLKNYELNYRSCSPEFLFTFVDTFTGNADDFAEFFYWVMGHGGECFELAQLICPTSFEPAEKAPSLEGTPVLFIKAEINDIFEQQGELTLGASMIIGAISKRDIIIVLDGEQEMFRGPIAKLRRWRDDVASVSGVQGFGLTPDWAKGKGKGKSAIKVGMTISVLRENEDAR